ncbi:MAG TPA: MFS transporter [Acidiphilium sp.]
MVHTASHPRRWTAFAILVAAQFMFVVDAFIANIAIPSIRADLHANGAEIEAVIAIYQIAYASVLITGGRLGDIFGCKPLFLIGLAGFTAASAWCGMAPSAVILIVARAVQGAAAGLMVPQVLASVRYLFATEEHPRAFGIFGIALGLGAAAGMMLGGWLITLDPAGLGWRAVFLINIPVGAAAFVAGLALIPAIRLLVAAKLDLAGAVLLAAGILPLLGTILFGRDFDWPAWLAIPAIAGILFLAAFIRLESSRAAQGGSPLLDPAWLRDRGFATGLAATFTTYIGMTGFLLVLTLLLQDGLGYSPLDTGLITAPLAFAFLIASRIASRAGAGRGPTVVMTGAAIMAGGLLLIAAIVTAVSAPSAILLAVPLAVYGFGQGFVLAPLVHVVLARAHRVPAGAASGVLVTVQQMAGAIGIALIGLVYFGIARTGGDRRAFIVSAILLAVMALLAAMVTFRLRRAGAKSSSGIPALSTDRRETRRASGS